MAVYGFSFSDSWDPSGLLDNGGRTWGAFITNDPRTAPGTISESFRITVNRTWDATITVPICQLTARIAGLFFVLQPLESCLFRYILYTSNFALCTSHHYCGTFKTSSLCLHESENAEWMVLLCDSRPGLVPDTGIPNALWDGEYKWQRNCVSQHQALLSIRCLLVVVLVSPSSRITFPFSSLSLTLWVDLEWSLAERNWDFRTDLEDIWEEGMKGLSRELLGNDFDDDGIDGCKRDAQGDTRRDPRGVEISVLSFVFGGCGGIMVSGMCPWMMGGFWDRTYLFCPRAGFWNGEWGMETEEGEGEGE